MQPDLNPYSAPTSETAHGNQLDHSPTANQHPLVPWVRVGTLVQVPFGLFGTLGAFTLLVGDTARTETVEAIVLPFYAWLLSVPIAGCTLYCYWQCRHSFRSSGRVWVSFWTVLPTVALITAIVAATRY